MKRLLYYLPFHFVVFLFLGIYTQFYGQIWQFGFLKLIIFVGLISVFLMVFYHKKIITFVSFLLFFLIGISVVYFNNAVNYTNYYQNYLKENSTAILKVDKVLKSSFYHDKYEVEVVQVDNLKTKGKVLLNIQKDSLTNLLKVDELLMVKANFEEVVSPQNPHQFNYKDYLKRQGIYQQLFLENRRIKSIGFARFSLKGISAKFRNRVQESLEKYNFNLDELAVVNALLLGQRQEISKELLEDYSKAGAIHILAVSGLHVGIILLILSSFFKPLVRLKNGRIIKALLIVLFLWMFAFIAGLSASVVRAVTMFTFLAIGMAFQRKKVTEFSLIASMFLLLIFKPMFLFDVGFQLSYLAVFGIVWIQPKLYKIYTPRFFIDKKIWELITVSIAAQVGVLPLSLFYFHQFPGLFMLSNLVIIPCLGAILIGGIIIIFLAMLGFLPQFLAAIYGYVISLMNAFVSWISRQEQFLLTEISLSFIMMLIVYIVIVFGIHFLTNKSAKRLIYFLVSFMIYQGVFLFENYQKKTKQEFILFHKSRNSIIGNRVGEQLLINHDLDSLKISKINSMVSYRVGEKINAHYKTGFSNVYQFKNQLILVVDSLGIYQLKKLRSPIVILQQSPKINLERLIRTLNPKQIIADGSNYKSYVNRWKVICEKQKTPFHYTGKNGAYIIKN